jgi:hypothetical protein
MESRHWQATIQIIKFELLPLYLKFSFVLFFQNPSIYFFFFDDDIFKAKFLKLFHVS